MSRLDVIVEHHGSFYVGLTIALLLCAAPALPQTAKAEAPPLLGVLHGTIVDDTGAAIPGATISLAQDGTTATTEVVSRENGQFSFPPVSSGSFHLTVSALAARG